MKHLIVLSTVLLLMSCSTAPETTDVKLFELMDTANSGISFNNKIEETEDVNYFTYPYLFMGGGVAIGDFNNDGLEDIFFTGNQVANKLYVNKGNLNFEDVTQTARLAGDSRWYTGVSVVDINSDGWLDIYVSVAGLSGNRKNELYINNGNLTFTESAEEYGIADEGYSYQGTFFDYDRDGDLDLLVINYPPTPFNAQPKYYEKKMESPIGEDSDHFYENINGKFVDVTKEAGLLNFGLTISASISDFNNDGFQDIYLNNDFGSTDFLYLNNGDKSFKEVVKEATNHTAMYSMGSDVADFDHDGLMDFVQLDMNPPDNYRNKANMASMNIPLFWAQVESGLHYQYMHNVLQLNSGIEDGIPHFSDISQITGISSTDWSWSVLAMDVDNDAHKDLFITNGSRRDINNRDFFNNITKGLNFATPKRKLEESKKIPSKPIVNYLYKNEGDLNFQDVSESSGIDQPSFSNGMAYGDLDNDGDLEVVINNIDQKAFIYKNNTSDLGNSTYVKIKLTGNEGNVNGIGSRIEVVSQKNTQTYDQMPVRGFQSTVSNILHFGLGSSTNVDSIKVTWPDGKVSLKTNIAVNKAIVFDYKDASSSQPTKTTSDHAMFKNVALEEFNLDTLVHKENDFDDFGVQILLPHKMSQFGPALVVADFNNNGRDDIFFGGSSGNESMLYFQLENSKFEQQNSPLFKKYASHEDVDAIALDFDGDNDLDIYVVSGGNEFKPDNPSYGDRLYINDGNGNFIDGTAQLPKNYTSGSVVKAFDYDNDGDLDLFLGTRHKPHNYPLSQGSFIFENQNGTYVNVTEKVAPQLSNAGMVTDAVWVDVDLDDHIDLVIVGEWMEPLVLLQKNIGEFINISNADVGLENMAGWWYAIEKADLDNDGDMDLVLGNLGNNYKYQASLEKPFKVFAKDFNNSGKTHIVLSYSQGDSYYPVRGKQCSSQQIPGLKEKFKDYESFATADVDEIYSDMGLKDALELNANNFSSYILKNENGNFAKFELPNYAQISSINDILINDFNKDGTKELLLAGNLYTSEVETTRNDASYGSIISIEENLSKLNALKPSESGLFIRGDCKKIDKIKIGKSTYVIAALNDEAVSMHRIIN